MPWALLGILLAVCAAMCAVAFGAGLAVLLTLSPLPLWQSLQQRKHRLLLLQKTPRQSSSPV